MSLNHVKWLIENPELDPFGVRDKIIKLCEEVEEEYDGTVYIKKDGTTCFGCRTGGNPRCLCEEEEQPRDEDMSPNTRFGLMLLAKSVIDERTKQREKRNKKK
tara:strand:- start:410 stop:718 length:309 start_codon:yes stop_codon:yes gene_type:complete